MDKFCLIEGNSLGKERRVMIYIPQLIYHRIQYEIIFESFHYLIAFLPELMFSKTKPEKILNFGN